MPADRRAPRPGILVFEPDSNGHPLEWLRHLIRFAASDHRDYVLHLVIAPALHPALAQDIALVPEGRVRLIALQPEEAARCTHPKLTVSAFARWRAMRRYLRATGAAAGYFLGLDHATLPLALGLGFDGKRVGGILFRPSTHYATIGQYRPDMRERLRDWRKAVLYRLMLANRSLASVATLDPYFADFASHRYAGYTRIQAIGDPVPEMAPVAASNDPARARTGFLLFGYLAERKGVMTTIEALHFLSKPVAASAAFLMAGAVDPQLRPRLMASIESLRVTRPDIHIRLDDRRIGDGELSQCVADAGVILAPYRRFVGSSGVLLWAAQAGKPVITQEYGLLGRLLRDYRIGLAVDTDRPQALAWAIERMVEEGPHRFFDPAAARAFLAGRTPRRFAADIIDAALETARSSSLFSTHRNATARPSLVTTTWSGTPPE